MGGILDRQVCVSVSRRAKAIVSESGRQEFEKKWGRDVRVGSGMLLCTFMYFERSLPSPAGAPMPSSYFDVRTTASV